MGSSFFFLFFFLGGRGGSSGLLGWFYEDSTDPSFYQTMGWSSLAELRGVTCTPPSPLISSTKWSATSIEHQREKQERGIFSVYEAWPPESDAQPQEKEVPSLPVALWGPHGAWTQRWTGLTGLAEDLGKELVTWHQVCHLTGQHCPWHMLLRTRRALHLRDLHAAQAPLCSTRGWPGRRRQRWQNHQPLSSSLQQYVHF